MSTAVQLYRERDCPSYLATHVFREARSPSLIVSVVLWLFCAGWSAGAWAMASDSIAAAIGAGCMAFFCGLGGLAFASMARATFGRANWLLRYGPDGFLIKLRSYQNAHFPDETPCIAWLPAGDVQSIHKRVERHVAPFEDTSGVTQKTNVFLDLFVPTAISRSFGEALDRERRIRPPRRYGVATRSHHTPIWVHAPGVLRIAWRGAGGRITPSIDRALKIFRTRFAVETSERGDQDWRMLEGEDFDQHLVELAEAGETIGAVSIAARRFDVGTGEALRYVEELRSRKRDVAPEA